jgi:patatin-like phospholipase/acyl hydrolase
VHELLHERYPSETIDRTLERYFGDTRLSAAATEVLVTSYDLASRDVFLTGSRVARDQPELDLPMRVAARATSAAPTYFEPVAVTTGVPPQPRLLIDGGVCANNPAMCAFVEVQRAQPGADVLMLSLGTGLGTRPYDVRQVPEWGLAHWARVILHVVIDGASEMVHVQLREMLDDRRYHRLQVELGDASETLDDATEANIARLRAEAERLVARSDRELDELCAELTR